MSLFLHFEGSRAKNSNLRDNSLSIARKHNFYVGSLVRQQQALSPY